MDGNGSKQVEVVGSGCGWSLTVPVCLHVALQAALLVEEPAADEAAVRFLPGVDQQVSLQVPAALEHLATGGADEALLRPDGRHRATGPLQVQAGRRPHHRAEVHGRHRRLGASAGPLREGPVPDVHVRLHREGEDAAGGFDGRREQLLYAGERADAAAEEVHAALSWRPGRPRLRLSLLERWEVLNLALSAFHRFLLASIRLRRLCHTHILRLRLNGHRVWESVLALGEVVHGFRLELLLSRSSVAARSRLRSRRLVTHGDLDWDRLRACSSREKQTLWVFRCNVVIHKDRIEQRTNIF